MKMYKKVLSCVLLAAMVAAVAGCGGSTEKKAAAPKAGGVKKITIGSGSATSNVFVNASAIANAVNTKLKGKYDVSVETSVASAGNVELLQAGEIQIGMISSDISWEGYNGKFAFENKKCAKLRTLFPGASATYIFVTKPSTGIKNIEGFNGTSYSGGSPASANSVFTKRVFDMFNIKAKLSNLPNADASRGLGDGTLQGFTHSDPSTVLREYEASSTSRVILLTEAQQKQFLAKYPQYITGNIKKGSYKGLPEGGKNIGLVNLIVTSSDVDEQTVYDLVKCVYENKDIIGASAKSLAKSLTQDNIGKTVIPYHPGTIKYFKEKGWKVPENLMPPKA